MLRVNHSDHTGQATSFPRARLVMDRTDFAALSQSPPPFFTQASTLQPWLGSSGRKELITGYFDVFGDGSVIMVALPGHTAGNHGLLVHLPRRGTMLLSGDALHSPEQLATHGLPPSNLSRSDSLASLDRIEGIVRDAQATLIIQHDPTSIAKMPLFPQGAE